MHYLRYNGQVATYRAKSNPKEIDFARNIWLFAGKVVPLDKF